ncbi:putative pre-rRNA-processing protein TSR2 [Helianthus annuus]|nr:putative pre-rRNA-processing protein TSR2 [Helianthus annuus]
MPAQLTPEAAIQLREGIGLLLGRWSALQMAIQNEWGGRDTPQRAQHLTLDIYQWLITPSGI